MWTRIEEILSSLQLTIVLLLGIAAVSIGGTFGQPVDGRYELFYQTPFFRLLLLLLAVNLGACTIKTIRRRLGDRRRYFQTLQAGGSEAGLPIPGGPTRARDILLSAGYRPESGEEGVIAVRHAAGRWGSTIVHLSILLIMAGALSAGFGFVGTLQLLTGDKSSVYYDWAAKADKPLGFEIRLDHFEPVYYPIELQFAVVDPQSGETVATVTTREGESVQLPEGITAQVVRYFFFEEDLVLRLSRNGVDLGEYHALGGKRQWEKNPPIPYQIKPLAYRDPIVRQLRSEVSVLRHGELVKRATIEVNSPLTVEGVTIYQTAYNRDKFGFWSAGFQLGRDPGTPIVWFGCIALVLGLNLAFFFPCRVVGLREDVSGCRLIPLSGFRGEAGEELLRQLQEKIAAAE